MNIKLYFDAEEKGYYIDQFPLEELEEKLSLLENRLIIKDNVFVRINDNICRLFVIDEKGTDILRVFPGIKVRLETDFDKLTSDMERGKNEVSKLKYKYTEEVYLHFRLVDLKENFLVLDMYLCMIED